MVLLEPLVGVLLGGKVDSFEIADPWEEAAGPSAIVVEVKHQIVVEDPASN